MTSNAGGRARSARIVGMKISTGSKSSRANKMSNQRTTEHYQSYEQSVVLGRQCCQPKKLLISFGISRKGSGLNWLRSSGPPTLRRMLRRHGSPSVPDHGMPLPTGRGPRSYLSETETTIIHWESSGVTVSSDHTTAAVGKEKATVQLP